MNPMQLLKMKSAWDRFQSGEYEKISVNKILL